MMASRAGRLLGTCALILAMILSVFIGVQMIPDRDVGSAADERSLSPTGYTALLEVGSEIAQQFTAQQDGLAGLELNAGIAAWSPRCAIDVHVVTGGSTLYEGQTPCSQLDASIPTTRVASFAPLPESTGLTFSATYSLVGAPGDAVRFELGRPQDPATVSAEFGPGTLKNTPDIGDAVPAAVPVYDGGSILNQAMTALERASLFGPWWTQSWATITWVCLTGAGILLALVAGIRGYRRVACALIVLVALARSLLWAALIPMLFGMDEPQHLSYVQYLGEQGLPGRDSASMPEAYSEQLQLTLNASNLFGVWPTDRYSFADAGDTLSRVAQASPLSGGRPLTVQYSPVYYGLGALFYRLSPYDGLPRFYDVRLASVVLGLLCAVAVFWFFSELFESRLYLSTALSLAVVMQPMMCHQFAIVNNDALVITGSVLLLAASMSLIRGGGGLCACLVGLGGAMAVLSKPQGVLVLPVAIAAVFLSARLSKTPLRTFAARAFQSFGSFVILTAWWPLLSRARGLGNVVLPSTPGDGEDRSLRRYIALQLEDNGHQLRERWVNQLFGNFAWLDVWFPYRVYSALAYLTIALALACFAWILLRVVSRTVGLIRHREPSSGHFVGEIWLCIGVVLLFIVGINAIGFVGFRADGTDTILQGRYVLPMLPALFAIPPLLVLRIGMVADSGWRASSSSIRQWTERSAALVASGILVLMCVLSTLGLGSIAERFLW